MSRRALLTGLSLFFATCAAQADTVQLFSFEDGDEGWTSAFTSQLSFGSTLGVTDGTQAAKISGLGPNGFELSLFRTTITSGPAFESMVALGQRFEAGDTDLFFNFDITPDFSNLNLGVPGAGGGFIQFGMFMNSNNGTPAGGFRQYTTGQFLRVPTPAEGESPALQVHPGRAAFNDGMTLTDLGGGKLRASVPLAQTPSSGQWHISVNPASNFFDIGFMLNANNFASGTFDVAFDNISISGSNIVAPPVFSSKTLFSWETPDNPATAGVDERFEGWTGAIDTEPAQAYSHGQTIVTTGATDGSFALGLSAPSSGFAFGSKFRLDSTAGDSQAQIDGLIADINSADRIAFDVTLPDDQFPNAPTFQTIVLSLRDDTGNVFRSLDLQVGNPGSLAGSTVTVQADLSDFFIFDTTDTFESLGGLREGSTLLQIALGTNSNDASQFFIDNFRLLTEISGLDGDYNDDGVVNAADYTVWRDAVGTNVELPNDPNGGTIGNLQYATWSANYGQTAGSSSVAVPEPAAVSAVLMALSVVALRRGGHARLSAAA